MTCSRVIIIHKGRIERRCDTPENLLGKIKAKPVGWCLRQKWQPTMGPKLKKVSVFAM
jgi:hypothetical protein